MDNFKTIEVRWFYPGVLSDELIVWFDTLGESPVKADPRTDVYLRSSSPDMGIKLRQGNLEVKYRQAKLGTIEIDGFNTSQVEQWSKWICVDDSAGLTPENIADKPGWFKVDKIRYQRLYQVLFVDPLAAISGEVPRVERTRQQVQLTPIAIPQTGAAAIEITRLQVAEQIWWTIACEYLGDCLDLDLQFLPLVRLLLSGCPIPISTSSISCGYPQWSIEKNPDVSVFTD